jgi:origin recognition complex subunit 4
MDEDDSTGPRTPSIASDDEEKEDLMAMDIDQPEDSATLLATPSKSSRRRSTKPQAASEDQATPQSNVRASGRQRKAPQRYENEVGTKQTPRSLRKAAATPSKEPRSARSVRSTRKSVTNVVDTDETGGEDSSAPEAPLSRRRLTRTAGKEKSVDTAPSTDGVKAETSSPLLNGQVMDDSYDPVAAQLQQDLIQDVDAHDESAFATGPLPDYAEQFQKLCNNGRRDELGVLSKIVLEKLSGKRLVPLRAVQPEYQKVYQLIEQTVTAGEGNSMLVMGSRGCGKTTMIESIISSLSKDHQDEFHVVRLNGFLHTDDRLALREIWRQLGRETNTEDEASKINSYADTMATLLALLSHPEELFGNPDNGDAIATAKSVVIVLDEFDLFATHPRQTLLYNLFDIAQARKAPLAVIGLTTKVDVTEALEKRVKSRFSHRYVFLPLAKTFDVFSDICLAGLSLEVDELEDTPVKSTAGFEVVEAWNRYLTVILYSRENYSETFADPRTQTLWDDKEFNTHLRRIYNQTKCAKDFFSSALLPLLNLYHSVQGVVDGELSPIDVPIPKSFTSYPLTCPDPAPLPFMPSMTGSASSMSLPLSLLLAATRLTALHDPGLDTTHSQSATAPLALSFPAAYAEYVRLLTSAKATASASGAAATGGRVWGRDVSREAWEKLVGWGVVVPLGSGNGTTDGKMFRVEVSFEEVTDMVGAGGALGRWWREGG